MTADDPLDVLVVESASETEASLQTWLRDRPERFRCTGVATVEEAAERLRLTRPDVVVADLSLPERDAMSGIHRLGLAAPDVPLVVVAPDLGDEAALEAVREGAGDFLDKGVVDANTLCRTVLHAVERHRLAERLTEQEERLVQAQRMETVAVLAGGVAHDFNNLLTVIRGRAELASRHIGADPKLLQDLGFIRVACDRASKLTRQLLQFSRRDVSRPRVLDINMVIEDLEPLLRSVVGDSVDLRMELDHGVGAVLVDAAHVEQVVVNLAVNARDAMPDGGVLSVETRRDVLDAEFCRVRSVLEPGFYTVLTVSDTGVGMDPETQARAFEPFFTTKPMGRGTGLGLATVYGVITEAGGEVSCNSELGSGTTFHVYFPEADAPLDEPSYHDFQPVLGRGEVVLLVEDDEHVRSVALEMLESCGYVVLEAEDGDAALRQCRSFEGGIDLMLTDVVMPGLSGAQLARKVRDAYPDIKVIFMSGYSPDARELEGVAEHELELLVKPFTMQALTIRVREVLSGMRTG